MLGKYKNGLKSIKFMVTFKDFTFTKKITTISLPSHWQKWNPLKNTQNGSKIWISKKIPISIHVHSWMTRKKFYSNNCLNGLSFFILHESIYSFLVDESTVNSSCHYCIANDENFLSFFCFSILTSNMFEFSNFHQHFVLTLASLQCN